MEISGPQHGRSIAQGTGSNQTQIWQTILPSSLQFFRNRVGSKPNVRPGNIWKILAFLSAQAQHGNFSNFGLDYFLD